MLMRVCGTQDTPHSASPLLHYLITHCMGHMGVWKGLNRCSWYSIRVSSSQKSYDTMTTINQLTFI